VAAVRLFRFPNPVNEVAARVVAAGVLLMAVLFLVTRQGWILLPLAYGFTARVLTGPRLSPLGQFATRIAAPRLGTKLVPGPPKRFAQGIGAVTTVSAAVAWWAGAAPVTYALIGLIVVAATLESVFAICVGCHAFAALMRAGVIPPEVCEACNDLRVQLRPR
jgi:Domain of unknown function (DUF4395)